MAEMKNADGWIRTTDLGLMKNLGQEDSQELTDSAGRKLERAENTDQRDPALLFIIEHWANLTPAMRERLLGMVEENPPGKSTESTQDLTSALSMLARLPLSDAERADAVRRLISPPQT